MKHMTATEVILKNKMYWEEKQPEFDRIFKKFFGKTIDRIDRILHTREILGPPATFMQDNWDLICVVMVVLTFAFLTLVALKGAL